MNKDWIRGGVAMVCLAAVGGLIYVGIDGGSGSDLVKALSLTIGILGLLFIALGITGKRTRN